MSRPDLTSGAAIARQVRAGACRAEEVVAASLARADAVAHLNAASALLAGDALAQARALDRARMAGKPLPPLAGVPFVVKNLLDLSGHVTLAGAAGRMSAKPAGRSAVVVEALQAAGAIPVALAQMDEYACGATGENAIGGPVRNPLDPARISGGSSAGTAALVAAGVAPIGIGSDTNGSIRAPASFCGIWGLRPTTGRLATEGCFPYAESLDAVGPMAASAEDLALAYRAMLGAGGEGAADALNVVDVADMAANPAASGLRVAVLGAGFADFAEPEAAAAVLRLAQAFASVRIVDLPEAAQARDAASILSAYEVARNHLARGFSSNHATYSPFVRQRMLAGLAMPRHWYDSAKRYQAAWRGRVHRLFDEVDLLLACATPYAATPIGAEQVRGARRVYTPRADAGHMTRAISLAGLPVVAAPIAGSGLPLGVQIIAAPWREVDCLRAAAYLESQGLCARAVAT